MDGSLKNGKDRLISAAKTAAGIVGSRVFSALNRADEIGGEVRDFILARSNSPTVRRISERLARIHGKGRSLFEADEKVERDKEVAAETAAAPPPIATAAPSKVTMSLGDPEIRAQIYGRESCAWTGRSITLFNNNQIDYDFIDLDDPENGIFEARLVPETKQNTVPYIFLRGEFVGGYNALSEIERLGQLEYRVMSEEEKKNANPALKQMVIARRENTDEVAPAEASDPAEAAG